MTSYLRHQPEDHFDLPFAFIANPACVTSEKNNFFRSMFNVYYNRMVIRDFPPFPPFTILPNKTDPLSNYHFYVASPSALHCRDWNRNRAEPIFSEASPIQGPQFLWSLRFRTSILLESPRSRTLNCKNFFASLGAAFIASPPRLLFSAFICAQMSGTFQSHRILKQLMKTEEPRTRMRREQPLRRVNPWGYLS